MLRATESYFSDRDLDAAFLTGRIGAGRLEALFHDNALHSAQGKTPG
jgi:hypothetical protein